MSTIAVVKKSGSVCIAADSQMTHGDMKQSETYEEGGRKIFTYGESLVGIAGSVAGELALLGALEKRGYLFDSRREIFDAFCEIHATLKEEYYLNPAEHDDDPYESSRMDVLIANPHGIFGVYALREVFEYSRFWATGSGRDFALGAMLSAYERYEQPEEIARCGIEAGIEFDVASGGPIESRKCALA